MLTLSTGSDSSGAKDYLMLEAKCSEIVCAFYCCRKAYTSAKHSVKLQPILREYTAEKRDFSTRSQAYKQLDTS